MNPQRRRRLLWVVLLVAASALVTTLVAMALQRNVAYLYTPAEVLRGDAGHAQRFRLGGMVARDSLRREPGSLVAYFTVTDGDAQLEVRSEQILPDLFREGQAVVVTGHLQGDRFIAEEVLAKHDETYMPREVADKMGQAHIKHDVPMPAPEAH